MDKLPTACDACKRPSQWAERDEKSLASRSNRAMSNHVGSVHGSGGDVSTSAFVEEEGSRG
jgi:hypothetical protein